MDGRTAPGWRIYLDGWHSPPGPAVLELEPKVADWRDVDVGNSETEEFTLKNTGEASVIIDVLIEGADAQHFDHAYDPMHCTMKPGDEETIGIRFRPTTPGFKSATLKIDADECDDASAFLKGYGKKSRSVNVIYTNFLKWLVDRSLLLENF